MLVPRPVLLTVGSPRIFAIEATITFKGAAIISANVEFATSIAGDDLC